MTGKRARTEWGKEIGTPIAVLSLEPNDLVARGLNFEHGYDDLDDVLVAWLNEKVALVRHKGSPSPGTEIVITNFRPEHPAAASSELEQALRALNLSKLDLKWTRPDVGSQPPRRKKFGGFKAALRSAKQRMRSRTKSSPHHA